METTYFSLATKSKFNKSLNHFFTVNDAVDDVESENNLADFVDEALDENEITRDQILPLVGAIVKDKFEYSYDSFNIPATISDFSKIIEETSKWSAIDIVMVYYNPNIDIFLINPKSESHWQKAGDLRKDQLVVIYARHLKREPDKKIEAAAIKAVEEMLAGSDVMSNSEFIDPAKTARKRFQQQQQRPLYQPTQQAEDEGEEEESVIHAPAPVKAPPPVPTGKQRSTPKYNVLVTNELFHNGNVESWKKVVESYENTYPDCRVSVFYEGELINDLNSLFKWGKVRSQSMIQFQVTGENIQGVSKLQKYLFEGASARFEQFLKIGVGKVLRLF